MSLLVASALLARPAIGLSDIKHFVLQCREGARRGGAEAAALIMLAEKANSFYERVEGIALTSKLMSEFVDELARDVDGFRRAAQKGDAAQVEALNVFASVFACALAREVDIS